MNLTVKTALMSLRLDFTASDRPEAQEACARLKARYGAAANPDVVVALGGDGFLLQTVHRYLKDQIPIFGMNRGSVGFLLNDYAEDNLMERILKSESTLISPLSMTARTRAGTEHTALAFNEVSLLRMSHQGAKLRILIDGKDVSTVPPNQRPVNMVFQSYAVFPHMTVLDNVAYGLKMDGVGAAERRERAEEALKLVQLAGYGVRKPALARRHPAAYGKGQDRGPGGREAPHKRGGRYL